MTPIQYIFKTWSVKVQSVGLSQRCAGPAFVNFFSPLCQTWHAANLRTNASPSKITNFLSGAFIALPQEGKDPPFPMLFAAIKLIKQEKRVPNVTAVCFLYKQNPEGESRRQHCFVVSENRAQAGGGFLEDDSWSPWALCRNGDDRAKAAETLLLISACEIPFRVAAVENNIDSSAVLDPFKSSASKKLCPTLPT